MLSTALGYMRQEYNVDDFSRVVSILCRKVPGIAIAMNIIYSFLTETEEDFEETLVLCRKYKFPRLFINPILSLPWHPSHSNEAPSHTGS